MRRHQGSCQPEGGQRTKLNPHEDRWTKLDRPRRPRPEIPGVRTVKDMWGSEIRIFTKEEVARHNKADDLWLVVGSSVYDATAWINMHPGGFEAILKRAGGQQDCLIDYEFHSSSARNLWRGLKIGELEDDSAGYGCAVM